ncbi:penicillin-binding protein [Gemella sp. 19428wG2_WT2a]|nr:penicillin-binding protein [Gemella sp. 19428wG2_WT2a]TFU60066.1 penicillin-binding protein [Gemella sp. WT2a]
MNNKKREPLSRNKRHSGVEPGGFISRRNDISSNKSNASNQKRVSAPISRRPIQSRNTKLEQDRRILEQKKEKANLIRRKVNSTNKDFVSREEQLPPRQQQGRRISKQRISKPLKNKTSIWWYIFKYGLALASVGVIAVFLLFSYWIFEAPEFNPRVLDANKKTVVYDVNDQEIAKLGNQIGDNAEKGEVPIQMQDAILATEDNRFFEHAGVDYWRLAGALLSNITSGFGSQGGSTISQQLIKRTFLDDDKNIKRKVQEAYLAYKLEQNYTKDEIFNMYINRIYYSDGVYGLKTAANYYYGKELKDLSLPQMAVLAGLPQQPNTYNPYDNPEAAKVRRDTVLYLMQYHGKISEAESSAAQQTDVLTGIIPRNKATRYNSSSEFDADYAAYMSQIEVELRNSNEFKGYEGDVLNLGLKVYTSLDQNIQKNISNSMNNNLANIKPSSDIAMVVLNNENSGISAIYGGKDFKFGGFNYATQSKLQPGSAIKPILAYAPAVEYLGWATNHIIDDSKIPGSNIQNWDRQFHGNITMNNALKMSLNIPAIKTYQDVGINRVKEYAANVGIQVTDDSITSPIGGSADGYSPLQMAAAYVPFSNGGYYASPKAIKRVLDDTGLELTEFSDETRKQVIKESTAYIMTSMLRNVTEGTAQTASIPGVEMGIKTGTTTFSEGDISRYGFDADDHSKDSWVVGYTNRYTLAVWQGFDAIDGPNKYMTSEDTKKTQSLYKINMQAIANIYPTRGFVAPNDVGYFRGGIKVLTAEDRAILAEEARRAEEERRRKEEEAKAKAEEERRRREEAQRLEEESKTTSESTKTSESSKTSESNSNSNSISLPSWIPIIGGNSSSSNDTNNDD